jgi:hypothetical protein
MKPKFFFSSTSIVGYVVGGNMSNAMLVRVIYLYNVMYFGD